jgi:hypothetical protein
MLPEPLTFNQLQTSNLKLQTYSNSTSILCACTACASSDQEKTVK